MTKSRLAALLLAALILTNFLAFQLTLASDGRQEDYPPQLLPTPTLADPLDALINPTPPPYPSSGMDFDGQLPVPIGIESGSQPAEGNLASETVTSPIDDSLPSDRGIVFLWLGFLATFLVFLTSVFGSIILFTRRNES